MDTLRRLALVAIGSAVIAGCVRFTGGPLTTTVPDAPYVPVPVVDQRPDLRIAGFECKTRFGDLLVEVTVENIGRLAAPMFNTVAEVNGVQVSTRTTADLAPGGRTIVGFPFRGLTAAVRDTFLVRATADDPVATPPRGEVAESDETNNSDRQICVVTPGA